MHFAQTKKYIIKFYAFQANSSNRNLNTLNLINFAEIVDHIISHDKACSCLLLKDNE